MSSYLMSVSCVSIAHLQAAVALVGDREVPLEDRLMAWDELEMLIESYVDISCSGIAANSSQAGQCQ